MPNPIFVIKYTTMSLKKNGKKLPPNLVDVNKLQSIRKFSEDYGIFKKGSPYTTQYMGVMIAEVEANGGESPDFKIIRIDDRIFLLPTYND